MSQVLEAQTGRERGSRPSGRLRREGIVPGVLYGMGMEPIALSVEWPALRRALNADGGLAAPIRLKVAGKEHLTLVKELQRHPVRRDVIHVDFLAVDPDVSVTVEVALVLSGVEELSASLHDKVVLLVHRLEVHAKPGAIPAELAIDVANMVEGAEFRLADLTLPAGVTTDTDPETVLVTAGGEGALASTAGDTDGAAEGEAGAAEGSGEG